jgi:hypothetical protein
MFTRPHPFLRNGVLDIVRPPVDAAFLHQIVVAALLDDMAVLRTKILSASMSVVIGGR